MKPTDAVNLLDAVDSTRRIPRWNRHFMFDRSMLSDHHYRTTHWILLIFDALPESEQKLSILLIALAYNQIHDLGEIFTGDVSHKVKREPFPELKQLLDKTESWYTNNLYHDSVVYTKICKIADNDPDAELIKAIQKAADTLDSTYEAVRELDLGNDNIEFKQAVEINKAVLLSLHETVRDIALPMYDVVIWKNR